MPDMSKLEINGVVYDVRDPTKAPAGYGLGAYGINLPLVADADSCHLNGWYRIDSSTVRGIGANAVLRVDSFDVTNLVQTAYSGYYSIAGMVIQRRVKFQGAWSEWEWVNPPMIPGVEYRTTERWNGKPVYTVLINCGTAIDGGDIPLGPYGLTSAIRIIREAGALTDAGLVIPYGVRGESHSFHTNIALNDGEWHCRLSVGSTYSGRFTLMQQLWYIDA